MKFIRIITGIVTIALFLFFNHFVDFNEVKNNILNGHKLVMLSDIFAMLFFIFSFLNLSTFSLFGVKNKNIVFFIIATFCLICFIIATVLASIFVNLPPRKENGTNWIFFGQFGLLIFMVFSNLWLASLHEKFNPKLPKK